MDPHEVYRELNLRSPSVEESRLRELHRWLTYEGLSAMLTTLMFFDPAGIVFVLLIGAAIIFTPYMLLRLYQTGHYGWMIGFAVTVGIPSLLLLIIRPDGVAAFALSMLTLATFYLYTWLLRYTVGEWLVELSYETAPGASVR